MQGTMLTGSDADVVDGIPPYEGQGEARNGPRGSQAPAIRRIVHRLGHLHALCAGTVEESCRTVSRLSPSTGNRSLQRGNREGR